MPQIKSRIKIKPGGLQCTNCSKPATYRVAIKDGACIIGVSCCGDCVDLPEEELLKSVDYHIKEGRDYVQSIPR
jgi:hypothetical protein